jgi:hypothetical protein
MTPSPYSLSDQLVFFSSHKFGKINIPVKSVEVIDNRYDTTKHGFFPVYKNSPRLVKFSDRLSEWMLTELNDLIPAEHPRADRKLSVVIQRFWFNNSADQRFTPFKQQLQTSLYYKLELFSSINETYYPLKRFEGVFTNYFNDQDTYKSLTDSLMKILHRDVAAINFASKETEKNAIGKEQFVTYLDKKRQRINLHRPLTRGIFASYDDFLQQKPLGDSVDVIEYKDYFERQIVACQLGIYIKGFLQPCNKYWGYYDGKFLFVNSGNGLFIKLTPWYNQFILADLQQIAFSKKRKTFVTDAAISTSSYHIIKDFAKAYHLFYQLDYDDGKLY